MAEPGRLDVSAAEHVGPDELYAGTLADFLEQRFTRLGPLGDEPSVVLRAFPRE